MSLPEMKEHQRENVEWARRVQRGILADQPGLGKSRSAIEAVDGAKTLVIAPSLVLSAGVWSDEVERWSADPSLYTFAPYTYLCDRVAGPKGGTRPVARLRPDYRGQGYEAVILDEAHYVKGRNTKWVPPIETLGSQADTLIAMTGTPIPNWSHELFNLLRLVYPHEAKRGTGKYGGFWRWAEEWFDTSPTMHSQGNPVVGGLLGCGYRCERDSSPEEPCEHYRAFVADNLGERWMRHLRKDCLDLPPLLDESRWLTLDSESRARYNELVKDFSTTHRGLEILAWSTGAKQVLLDRISTSLWLLGDREGVPTGGKFDALREDLQARDSPVLVLAHYRDTVDACAEVARSLGLDATTVHGGVSQAESGKRAQAFQRGKYDVLCGSLETLSEGLTLTRAKTAIFVEHSFKPSRNEQAMYRIHRMGQTGECTIIRYKTRRTVDEGKHRLLASKTDHQMRTLTAADLTQVLHG